MEVRKLDNIVILGGGTAGWITALYAKKVLPNSKITVIESKNIGILGAGEGSTPQLVSFMDFVGIPISDLIKNADATIKNGIKFTNWKNDPYDFFYHGFYSSQGLDFDSCDLDYHASSTSPAFVSNLVANDHINDFNFSAKISEENLVPFIKSENYNPAQNGILKFNNLGDFSIHFNAAKLAEYLKAVAVSRGVDLVQGEMNEIITDKNNEVTELKVNGQGIKSDFVFDCSGFHKQIIGKFYNAKWHSHSDKLPVDSAIPFFLPIDTEKDIPPYTEAIAMKHGWIWKIPTSERFGCGYVFDSSKISEDEAVKEINEHLGFEIEHTRTIKFSAGYYETPWINNVVAVGLSSGFIEPLEATSIWSTTQSLVNLFSNIEVISIKDKRNVEEYNKRFRSMSESIVNFIYFHYLTERKDTDFWKGFTVEKAPPKIKEMLDSWEHRAPHHSDFSGDDVWGMPSWLSVSFGIGRVNKKIIKMLHESSVAHQFVNDIYKENKYKQNSAMLDCTSHREFLKEVTS
jgi:tryptophan halogenase